jgi:hypothetical protein
LEGLATEDVGICMAILSILRPNCIVYCHLVYFVVIWYIFSILAYFTTFFGIFFPFWYFVPRKIWQPWTLEAVAHENGNGRLERNKNLD